MSPLQPKSRYIFQWQSLEKLSHWNHPTEFESKPVVIIGRSISTLSREAVLYLLMGSLQRTRYSSSQAILDRNLASIRVDNDVADSSDRNIFICKTVWRFSNPVFILYSSKPQINTRNEIPFSHRFRDILFFFGCFFFFCCFSTSPSIISRSNIATNQLVPEGGIGTSGLNINTTTNQPSQNDASIHCETSAERRYRRLRPLSHVDTLHSIPRKYRPSILQQAGNKHSRDQRAP